MTAAANEFERLDLPVPPDGDGFVYRQGGEILGFVSFEPGAEVEATGAVHPAHRRKGIGTILLKALTAACRQGGTETCYLVVDEASPSGRAFALHTGGRYHISEFRMVLDRERFHAADADGTVSLRQVGVDALDEFASLLSAGFGTPLEQNRAWLSTDMRSPHRRFWIAERDGVPIGTVRVIGLEPDVYTTALTVIPEYRGQGWGRRILSEITGMLMEEGWEQILIEVETENRNALGLYRSIGYREIRTYGFYKVTLD